MECFLELKCRCMSPLPMCEMAKSSLQIEQVLTGYLFDFCCARVRMSIKTVRMSIKTICFDFKQKGTTWIQTSLIQSILNRRESRTFVFMCSFLFTFDARGFKMPLSRVLREDHVNTNNAQSVLFKICALAGQIGLRAGQRDRGSKCVNVAAMYRYSQI